ncbi:BRCA1-A complex subunit Abraxas 1 [Chanos chanos]|uniref:BRCA1-A complex subunit Abraxas 1 n=1 Tax=Chanos chanos TaxID=29144 RepID=A0A6J2UYP6_CHACN|nr:BRCA1-A complex subunit Abraxas 1 [Chanos chanos]
MAEFKTTVRMSGFVLSSLMFQHLNSDTDVEGFILGERVAEERSNITDSQIDQVQLEHTISIQKHVPCRALHTFYNNVGMVNRDEISRILSNHKEDSVIGWYRQRRNTHQQMTFKEQLIHQNLKKALSNQELVFVLLTATEVTSSGSTHRLEYSTFVSHGSQYHKIPILVNNLGMLEQQDYWRVSTACSSLSHSQAVRKCRSKFLSSDDNLSKVEHISNMNDILLTELKNACKDVEESERSVEKLRAEVTALREAISKRSTQQKRRETKEEPKPDECQENVLLCTSLKALFPNAPLLRTQALTLEGFPVLELCCDTDHDIDISAKLPLILDCQHTKARKRKLDTWERSSEQCLLPGLSPSSKRKKNLGDTTGLLFESGSDTEVELTGENKSSSPVF